MLVLPSVQGSDGSHLCSSADSTYHQRNVKANLKLDFWSSIRAYSSTKRHSFMPLVWRKQDYLFHVTHIMQLKKTFCVGKLHPSLPKYTASFLYIVYKSTMLQLQASRCWHDIVHYSPTSHRMTVSSSFTESS